MDKIKNGAGCRINISLPNVLEYPKNYFLFFCHAPIHAPKGRECWSIFIINSWGIYSSCPLRSKQNSKLKPIQYVYAVICIDYRGLLSSDNSVSIKESYEACPPLLTFF